MDEDREFEFTIYLIRGGVHFTAPVRGVERFMIERDFLDHLVAKRRGYPTHLRSIPDPSADFYDLTDDELEAYSAFRHRQDAMR